MKTKLLALLILCALLLSGCCSFTPFNIGKKDKSKETKAEQTTKAEEITETEALVAEPDASETEDEDIPVPVDYETVYNDVIYECCQIILKADPSLSPLNGIAENLMNEEPGFALENLGYALIDVNGDMIPELVYGEVYQPYESCGSSILAMYSIVNEKPELVFDGWSRSSYSIGSNNKIYHNGSNGAMSDCVAEYTLPVNSNDLKCERFYFTEYNIASNEQEFYYNSQGEWSVDSPSSKKITEYEYNNGLFSMDNHPKIIDFISFFRYNSELDNESTVKVRSIAHFFNNYENYNIVTVDSEYTVRVVLTVKERLTDFELYRYTEKFEDDSSITPVKGETVYTDDSFEEYEALEIEFSPGEVIPTLALDYTDTNGNTVTKIFVESGKDGNIYLTDS